MTQPLPRPLADYFDASNGTDAERIAACFAPDAIVHDEGEDRRGRAAIEAWAAAVRKKYKFVSTPFAVEERDGATLVRAHVAGNFPGSPIDLAYLFVFEGDAIKSLRIAP